MILSIVSQHLSIFQSIYLYMYNIVSVISQVMIAKDESPP